MSCCGCGVVDKDERFMGCTCRCELNSRAEAMLNIVLVRLSEVIWIEKSVSAQVDKRWDPGTCFSAVPCIADDGTCERAH